MNIAELLQAVGPDKIEFQWLTDCIGGKITNKKGVTRFTVGTDAVTIGDLAFNKGKVGMLVWVPRESFDAVVAELKSKEAK